MEYFLNKIADAVASGDTADGKDTDDTDAGTGTCSSSSVSILDCTQPVGVAVAGGNNVINAVYVYDETENAVSFSIAGYYDIIPGLGIAVMRVMYGTDSSGRMTLTSDTPTIVVRNVKGRLPSELRNDRYTFAIKKGETGEYSIVQTTDDNKVFIPRDAKLVRGTIETFV